LSDTPNQSADALLLAAAEAIRQRAALRDLPEGERSMARAIAAYNALTGGTLSELDGWLFMCILKLSRATAGEAHIDDYTDLAGYAALAAECLQREAFSKAFDKGTTALDRAQQMCDDLLKTDFTPHVSTEMISDGLSQLIADNCEMVVSDIEIESAWADLSEGRAVVITGDDLCHTVRCRRHEAIQIVKAHCAAFGTSPRSTHYDGLFLSLFCGDGHTKCAEIADAILRANAVASDTAA